MVENNESMNDMEEVEELDNVLTLEDEDGNEIAFEVLDIIDYNGAEYALVLPVESDDDETGEVVILEIENNDGGEESFVSVEDEAIIEAVFEIFKEKYKDQLTFE